MDQMIRKVYDVVLERKANPSSDSYVCKLLDAGEDKILQKVGEEAVELILAAKSGEEKALVYEAADLVFHLLVLLGSRDVSPEAIGAELQRRFGISGLEEKRSRGK